MSKKNKRTTGGKKTNTNVENNKPNYGKYNDQINKVNHFIYSSVVSQSKTDSQAFRNLAITELKTLVDGIQITDYLLIDSKPELPHKEFVECCFNLGTLIKNWVEVDLETNGNNYTEQHTKLFKDAISYLMLIIRVKFQDFKTTEQISSIYTKLCFYNQVDPNVCLRYLHEALLIDTTNPIIHYNLGFIYSKLNKLELSLIHYKLSNRLIETVKNENGVGLDGEAKRRMYLNNYNGITFIYRSIKQWPEALFYLKQAETIDADDPDIQNQLGVVYTEMRRTDLAEHSYLRAIENYKRSFISGNQEFLLSEIYLNYGHMFSYNGDNNKSIDCYNKALSISPKFSLPFQNKIMNLSYIFDQLEDKMYILNQHKLVNRLYKHGDGIKYKFDRDFFNLSNTNDKINIGIVSGDFVDHPVSYFIGTLLRSYNTSKFSITCYSECLINTELFNKDIKFKFIKNMSQDAAADLIYNDNIHILFDLAGHTAFNRLDVFAMRPSPVQVTYIGYPYSTGLKEMDYRITDQVCDNSTISQKFYTEQLIFTKGCFLCYDSKEKPQLAQQQPFLKNGWITIGCFNRLNKISDKLIAGLNYLMQTNAKIRLVFKTKALLNTNVRSTFLQKFDKGVRERINIIDCNITHIQHLEEYNNLDIAIDTMPYSGTTTSCEALLMGVPVYTFYDNVTYFHPQNVTASILTHSHNDFKEWIIDDNQDAFQILSNKIIALEKHDTEFWRNLKQDTRTKFLTGDVCNGGKWIKDFEELLLNLYTKRIEQI